MIGISPINPTPNAGRLAITLKPRDQRRALLAETSSNACRRRSRRVPGLIAYFQPVQDIQIGTRASRAQYQYTLTGTNAEEVNDWSKRLAERLRAAPVLREVASEVQDSGLRAFVRVDREQAARLGVSMQTVNDTLNTAFGQRQISTIYGQSNQYRVILEAMPEYQTDPSWLSKLYVPASPGGSANHRAPAADDGDEQSPGARRSRPPRRCRSSAHHASSSAPRRR